MSRPAIRTMPLTVGGIPHLSDIIGRDTEANEIMRLLASGQSALLTGDRRLGKTCVSRVVESKLRAAGHHVVRVSAERASFADFLTALARELETQMGLATELRRWEPAIKAGPFESRRKAPTFDLDQLLESAVARADGQRVVLIVDEIPILARAMERQSPGSGAAVLDTLRRVRQEHGATISMLLLGSIGFHHVAQASPGSLNDITKVHIGPVSETDGVYLARCLMVGAAVDCVDHQAFALAIHRAAEGIPFYIQHLVRDARDSARANGLPDDSLPARLVEAALHDEDDPWHLRHYRDRVPDYYPGREGLVFAILDIFAGSSSALPIDEVLKLLAVAPDPTTVTRRELVELVELLEQDHYLKRVGLTSTFRSEVVRRAWIATWR